MKRLLIFAFGLVLATADQLAAAAPELLVRNRHGEADVFLSIESAALRIEQVHDHAKVDFTLVFRNPTPQALEGEFTMPLPPGAVVIGYALDVNGEMRDGVAVPREKAKLAYETIKRMGIDPGYVEREAGNIYRTKIFPIPRNGTKAVRLTWLQAMEPAEDGLRLRLPLDYDVSVGRFEATMIPGHGIVPKVVESGGLEFSEKETGVLKAERAAHHLNKAWQIDFPALDFPSLAVEPGKDRHFHLVDNAPIEVPPLQPARIRVIWDGSSSRIGLDIDKDLAVFDGLAKAHPAAKFEATIVRDVATDWHGDVGKIRQALADAADDGFADWSQVKPTAADLTVVFTDLTAASLQTVLPNLPGMVVVTHAPAPVANHGIPRCVPILTHSEFPAAAMVAKILTPRLGAELVTPSACQAIEYPELIYPGERVRITGKAGESTEGWLIRYSSGGNKLADHPVGKSTSLVASVSTGHHPLATLHALAVQARLEDMPVRDDAATLAHGLANGLVGDLTSLVVLETLEHYVQYRIPPPDREMLKVYQFRISELDRRKPSGLARRDSIFGPWEERSVWRQTSYPWIEEKLVPMVERSIIWADAVKTIFKPGQYDGEFLAASQAWKAKAQEWIAAWEQLKTREELLDWAGKLKPLSEEGASLEQRKTPPPASGSPVVFHVGGDVGKKGIFTAPSPVSVKEALFLADADEQRGSWLEMETHLYRNGVKRPVDDAQSAVTLLHSGDILVVYDGYPSGGGGSIDDPFAGGGGGGGAPQPDMLGSPSSDRLEPASLVPGTKVVRIVVAESSPAAATIAAALTGQKDPEAAYRRLAQGLRHEDSFYFEAARVLAADGHLALSRRVLGNLLELPGNAFARQRQFAHALWQIGDRAHADALLARLGESPEEKALVILDRAHFALAAGESPRAISLLLPLVNDPEAPSFLRALALAIFNTQPRPENTPVPDIHALHPAFSRSMDSDLRILVVRANPGKFPGLSVEEPLLPPEICHYSSRVGGRIFHGHGLAEYQITRALPGDYRALVRVHEPTLVTAFFFTHWGKPNQSCQVQMVAIPAEPEPKEIGRLTFELSP